MGSLDGKTIAIVASDGVEQSELTSPKKALEHEGAVAHVLSLHEGTVRGWKDKNWAESVPVDGLVSQANAADYDALMLPGGVMNPDHLRNDAGAVAFIKSFIDADKPIAAICHGGQTLITAGGLEGRKLTSFHSLQADYENAGAEWVDEAVVVDGVLVTSRTPDDLPMFNEQMVKVFANPAEFERAAPVKKKAPARRRTAKRATEARARSTGKRKTSTTRRTPASKSKRRSR